jgi:Flp pilus assembly protein TadD
MKAGDVRICPFCQSRNKAKWEFCARCGESLQAVPLGTESETDASDDEAATGESGGFPVGWATAGLLLVGVGATAWLFSGQRPVATRPDPSVFAVPVVVTPPPSFEAPAVPPSKRQLGIGRGMLTDGNYGAAVEVLAQSVAEDPEDATTRYFYAHALWQTNAQAEAVNQFKEAARLSPRNVEYRGEFAKALAATGQTEEAIAEYQAALELKPDSPVWLRTLASLQSQAGRPAEAASLLKRAATLRPADADVQQSLAVALDQSGNAAGAEDAYRKALATDPQAATSRALLANVWMRQGKRDDAIALVREGIALNPKSAELQRDLGSLLEAAGRTAEAVAAYREYAGQAPSAPDAAKIAERARMLEQQARAPSSPGPS